jgi:hypothetical protein
MIRQELTSKLRLIGWVTWLFMLLWCVAEIEVALTHHYGVRTGLVDGFATVMVFGPAVYLCLLWIWVNYALHLAAINLVEHKITDESVDCPHMDPREDLMQVS